MQQQCVILVEVGVCVDGSKHGCRWDSWILDVAVCNLIGLLTGMATVRYFGSQRYNWRGISEQPTLLDKVKRGAGQFLPYSVDNLDWGVFSSPAR